MRTGMKAISITFSIMLVMVFLTACTEETYPKPKGYPRIDLPAHSYKSFSNETCPFEFEMPEYATISRNRKDSCYVDLFFPESEYYWHISYRNIPESPTSYTLILKV